MENYISEIRKNLRSILNLSLEEIEEKVHMINRHVDVAKTEDDLNDILKSREETYSKILPEVNYKALEPMDFYSIILCSRNEKGEIESTSRMVFDSEAGFAEDYVYEEHIQRYREESLLLAEWGRCIVSKPSRARAADHGRIIEHLAKVLKVHHVCIFNRHCDVQRMLSTFKNTKVLVETDITLGSIHKFTAVLWSFPEFALKTSLKFTPVIWKDYSLSFKTVTTIAQVALFKEAVKHLFGNVLDLGAGCAKIAPFLQHRPEVTSYTAIDASPHMCQYGLEVLQKISNPHFTIVESLIEDHQPDIQYDSAVSLNSFYTWPDPEAVLRHIYSLIKPGGIFILATINSSVDIERMIQEEEPALFMHPDAEKFKLINQILMDNKDNNLVSLNEIISLVQVVGFEIIECHNQFYYGGLSYLRLKKPDS